MKTLHSITLHRIAQELGVSSRYLDNFLDGFAKATNQRVAPSSENVVGVALQAFEAGYYLGRAQLTMNPPVQEKTAPTATQVRANPGQTPNWGIDRT